ncbi:hypothetical protein [Pseudomonas phoenicis]|uniref:hypothetical protein n=1 Tax=unclassified Pseudomonas TaxID=196821 RepID=UPI00399F2B85
MLLAVVKGRASDPVSIYEAVGADVKYFFVFGRESDLMDANLIYLSVNFQEGEFVQIEHGNLGNIPQI